jgi:cyclic beta-1,2-glucan synthetase
MYKSLISETPEKEILPLRAELFSAEQLKQHALHLAQTLKVSHEKSSEKLLKELADNEKELNIVIAQLQAALREKKEITPAGEWLLDNYYLIEEQIRLAQKYLPKNFSQSLPKLGKGAYAGYPRVYAIAVELLTHSDCFLGIENLSAFLSSYQKVECLTIGELWALPIMLRLALIENLKRVAVGIAADRFKADMAEFWVDKLFEKAEENPRDLVMVIADMAKSKPPLNSAFVAEFSRRLQWKGPGLNLALNWIEQSLSENGDSISSMVLAENQKKAADQVSMSNSITSLRYLSKIDWREFVETLSVIEQILRTDNHGTYSTMDFETRNRYRHVVEDIAKNSPLSEKEVAELAIRFTQDSAHSYQNRDARKLHVGYFLLDRGVEQLKKKAGYKLSLYTNFVLWLRSQSDKIYFIAAFIITFGISAAFLVKSSSDIQSPVGMFFMVVLSVLVSSYFAFSIVNWWMTLWILPKSLPRMDFSDYIPDEFRTLVAIPTLLANKSQIEELLYDLEIRYLANRDENLLFALVTDFRDADEEVKPGDDALVEIAVSGILELNKRYNYNNNDKFFLFHRPRKWNPSEGVWMGYERKRGKLKHLNQLLRGDKSAFSVILGDERKYTSVKYVITLDTDTQLPKDAAWKMVGQMAHPLNIAMLLNQIICAW